MNVTRRPPFAISVLGIVLVMSGGGQAEDGVQSRGLNLPSVSVPAAPAPPPPPAAPAMYGLTIRPAGDGSGTVPLPPAATCPPTCSAQYPRGTPVILAPVPAPGSTFAGWAGDCRGTGPCTLRMDRSITAEARFMKLPPPASASASPTVPMTTPAAPVPLPIPYPVLPSQLGPELNAISTMLADGQPATTILDAWKGYVTRRVHAKQPLDVPGTIQQVQRQAEAQVRARTDAQKARLAGRLQSAGDDAQLANVELQNLLHKQQQVLQIMSNTSKTMHDTAMAIIRKIAG